VRSYQREDVRATGGAKVNWNGGRNAGKRKGRKVEQVLLTPATGCTDSPQQVWGNNKRETELLRRTQKYYEGKGSFIQDPSARSLWQSMKVFCKYHAAGREKCVETKRVAPYQDRKATELVSADENPEKPSRFCSAGDGRILNVRVATIKKKYIRILKKSRATTMTGPHCALPTIGPPRRRVQ